MASFLPGSSFVGSAASGISVHDVIQSYRRSQYLATEHTVPTDSELDDDEDDLEEGLSDDEDSYMDRTPIAEPDGFVSDLRWDELEGESSPRPTLYTLPSTQRQSLHPSAAVHGHETEPLLRKVSFSVHPTEERTARPIIRRQSTSSINRKADIANVHFGGQSTFGQTLFNSVAVLLGIGLLSEPLAFAYAGWGMGVFLISFYGLISCYTAKILARIILSDSRLKSYADIGRKAFGPRSTVWVSAIFCLELFGVSVVLVTLFADSLHSVVPHFSANTYKVWGLLFLIPTVFMPLSLLSYTSILSIFATLMIVFVVLVDGFSKMEFPGSIWSPAPTSLGIDSWRNLGVAFGLFMAGFSGHAVLPSLAKDMRNPAEFDRMINWAFLIATTTYAVIGCAGYLMFGNDVSDEISMDLLRTPGYNHVLNQASLWMLVISPLTKFALTTQPLNITLEVLFGMDTTTLDHTDGKCGSCSDCSFRRIWGLVQRIIVCLASVMVSILVPEFSAVMAFLGSFAAFAICVIGPISAKIAIEGSATIFDIGVLLISIVMGVWGTAVMIV